MKCYKLKELLLRRSFFSSSFGKCAQSVSKKAVSLVLCFLIIVFNLTVPSFAANNDGNMDFYAISADLSCYYYDEDNQNVIPLSPITTVFNWKDREAFRIRIPQAEGSLDYTGPVRFVESFTLPNLHSNHEYTLDFWYAFNTASYGALTVLLEVLDGNQNLINTPQILYYSPDNIQSDTWTNCNISFKPDLSSVQSGYSCRLVFQFSQVHNGSPWTIHISNYIYFNDNDDDSGLLNNILDWLSRIYHSVAGGTDREGVNHTGIVQGIKNGLSSLGDRIGNFFDDFKSNWNAGIESIKSKLKEFSDNITSKIEDIKNSISNKIDEIKNSITKKIEDIKEEIKSWFIPSDGYFESKKTELENFCTEHFGALYQVPDLMIEFIKKFTTMSPKQPSITLPAIQFDFQGKRYVLSESITYSFSWVNDKSHMLYYFYQFYRGFVSCVLFFGFANYCLKKYNEVFGGKSE